MLIVKEDDLNSAIHDTCSESNSCEGYQTCSECARVKVHKLSIIVTEFIYHKAMTLNQTFSQTLDDYVLEKMNEDTAKYMEFVDNELG